MMKRILLIIAFFMSVTLSNAQKVKTVSLSFSKQQFSFVNDASGAVKISTEVFDVGYSYDTTLPGLPLIAVNVGIPNGVGFEGISINKTQQLIYENIVVAANPTDICTNFEGNLSSSQLPIYTKSSYPNENVKYICTSTMDGHSFLRFLVCPFSYDAQGKKLYLLDNMTLNIKLSDSPSFLAFDESVMGNNMKDVFMTQIVNPADFRESEISTQGISIGAELSPYKHITERYLIVTSNSLAPYFEPLARWKTTKGFKSKIVTVEDILANQNEADTALAIKKFLYDEYKNNHLKYVLLGADYKTIPPRNCYYDINGYPTTPSDLYYACFDKCFSWDANGNGVYGELADSIDMTPSIIVTRAGVRYSEDVKAFVNKIIGYERSPNISTWKNNILMCGIQSFPPDTITFLPGFSDAQIYGNELYEAYIRPYWNGSRICFYDTYTDFPGCADYDVTSDNLQYQLSQGYTFFDMIAHGARDHWRLEKGNIYLHDTADSLVNANYTIITTVACHTNYFCWPFRSVSENFMRNPQSGVVAYLGCSMEGWEIASLEVEKKFYKNMFANKIPSNRYGEIVAATKSSRVNLCNDYTSDRWVQLGLNPLGDPEMPIYTTVPKQFANVSIKYSSDKKNLIVDTGVDSCSICFMSTNDNGASEYYTLRYARNATFSISSPTTICITKQNYVPYVATKYNYINRPFEISRCDVNSSSNTVDVSIQMPEYVKDASVVVASAVGNVRASYKVSADCPTVRADLSAFSKGVQTVSLVVGGKVVDSRNIVTKK